MELHISEEVFDLNLKKFSIEEKGTEWSECYTYLNHAESLLSVADTHLYHIDVISNLKRSIDHRLKLLSKIYDIKSISKLFRIKGTFETLIELSLIRPLMVKKLIDLRNCIEHQFIQGPPVERCEEYIEFTWYFLRSTDYLVKEVHTDIYFEFSNGSHYFIELDLNIHVGWDIKLSGILPNKFYENQSKQGFYSLDVHGVTLGKDFPHRFNEDNFDGHWDDVKSDDLHITNASISCLSLKKRIIKEYFALI